MRKKASSRGINRGKRKTRTSNLSDTCPISRPLILAGLPQERSCDPLTAQFILQAEMQIVRLLAKMILEDA